MVRSDLFRLHREFVDKYIELRDDSYATLMDILAEVSDGMSINNAYSQLSDNLDSIVRQRYTNDGLEI